MLFNFGSYLRKYDNPREQIIPNLKIILLLDYKF